MLQATDLVARRVPFDAGHFVAIDPDSSLPTWGACRMSMPEALVARWAELEFTEAFGGVAAVVSARRTVVRDADLAGAFDLSVRHREILRPLDLQHELRVVLRDHGTTWGVLSLFREAHQPDFGQEEVDILERMAAPLAQGLRRTCLSSAAESPLLDHRPAVVVLSRDLRVDSCTEEAEKLIPELRGVDCADPERLPLSIRALALRLGSQPAGPSVCSRARTRGGQWVTIRGATLDAERRIAIVIDRTPRADVVPLILAGHGLTARERKVAEHVLLGLSSQDVSEALGISEYTVQDHLKAVFDKTGVSSRKELAARLFANHVVAA
jgi:DNA-binding CsgD family transcriptional regulator